MDYPKYLVRPDDFAIYELNDEGLYGQDKRYLAHHEFTFQNLTENYGFFSIDGENLEYWKEKHQLYMDYMSWHCRPDGHGGHKDGTMKEYLERLKYMNDAKN